MCPIYDKVYLLILRGVAKKEAGVTLHMVKSSSEDYLILEKLDFVSHLKMENVQNHQISVNMLMEKLN
jgi:hypothetical protein